MTGEELEAKGYKRFDPSPIDNECVTDLYQKRFDDDEGKRYFINAKRWDFSRFNQSRADLKTASGFEYEIQFYKKGTHDALDMIFHSSWRIEDVERLAERMFLTGCFDYYEKWDD